MEVLEKVFRDELRKYIDENYEPEQATFQETQVIYTEYFGKVNLGEIEPGFSETVISLARQKYKRLSDFYTKACLSRQVASKMNTDPGYLPLKHNAFACIIALELTPTEAEELLRRGSYAFSKSSLMDVIVSYFVEHHVYDIDAINETLYEYGERTLGSV